jgi:lambda family phage portal protein
MGQLRGVSEFASVITRLEDVKDYEESERVAAKVAASLTAYVKRGSPDLYAGGSTDSEGNAVSRDISLAPGTIIDNLAIGEEIGLIDSKRPNPNALTWRQGQLRAVASGVGASYSTIARAYDGTYSSQRQELVEQWINYAILTDEFVGMFVQPVWEQFVLAAHLSGVVPMPKGMSVDEANDCLFIGQSMPWIDPLKEAASFNSLVRDGFASEVEVIRKRGQNPRDVIEQIAEFRKKVKEKELVFSSDAKSTSGNGAAQDMLKFQAANNANPTNE